MSQKWELEASIDQIPVLQMHVYVLLDVMAKILILYRKIVMFLWKRKDFKPMQSLKINNLWPLENKNWHTNKIESQIQERLGLRK